MAGKHDKIKDCDRYSIMYPNLTKCIICGSQQQVCIHEIFYGTSNRKKSKEYGLVAPLCFEHHQGTYGVHNNKALDLKLKQQAQEKWMHKYCDNNDDENDKINSFIKVFGKNYL